MLSKEAFMSVLNNMSGHATNKVMRRELACEAGEYQMARAELLKAGLIKLGRGRGGTVHIVTAQPSGEEGTATLGGVIDSNNSIVVDPFPEGWR